MEFDVIRRLIRQKPSSSACEAGVPFRLIKLQAKSMKNFYQRIMMNQCKNKVPSQHLGHAWSGISAIFIIVFLELHQIICQTIIKPILITANPTAGYQTSMPSDVADISAFRLSSSSDSSALFGYTIQTHNPCPGAGATKFFRMDGKVVFDNTCGSGNTASGIVLKSDDSFFLFFNEAYTDSNANSRLYRLTYNSGMYSYSSNTAIQPSLPNIGCAIGEDLTAYVYYFTDDNKAVRYDQNPPPGPPVAELTADINCPSPKSIYFHPSSTNEIIHYGQCGATPMIQFILKTDLTISKTLSAPPVGGEGAYTHTLNNLNPAQMYVGGSAKVYVYDIASSTTSWSVSNQLEDFGAVTNVIKSNFINFGKYQYMGFFQSTGSWPFQIYYKSSYAKVLISEYSPLYRSQYVEYSLLGPVKMPNSERFVIVFTLGGGYNMQSTYLDFDTCTTRSGGICSVCPTGYYINSPGVTNNWCYKEGFGVDPTILAPVVATDLAACPDQICANCASITTCTRCKQQTPQPLIDPTTGNCAYPPSTKLGRGSTEFWQSCTVQYCIICTEDKTYCNSCDPSSKTTAYNGLCVGPPTVQIGWGADWINGFAKPCNTTNCLDCFLDYQYCQICDKSKEYYLEKTWCKYYPDISDFKGGNPDTGLVVGCLDRGCIDCKRNYTICKKCNVPQTYYLDDWYCVLFVDIPYSKGVDAATGTLKKCSGPFCRNCFADYQVCLVCDYTTGYFRHNKTCISMENLESGVGPNLATGIVENCSAQGCIICNTNFQSCTTCDADYGYTTLNGGCVLNYEPTFSTYGFWDPAAKVVKVSFSIEPVYFPSFEQFFKDISVFDVKTGNFFSSDQLNGKVTRTQFGFTIKFQSNATVLSGTLTLPQSPNYRVLDKGSRLVYSAYPIQVTGIYLMPPTTSTQGASATLDSASQSRSLLTLAIFSFNPMVAVALDYMFNELFVLKLYEGPFMAYPELVLKTSAQSGILPFKLPNYFESGINEGECVPSTSFQTNDMNCVFLDNYGNDIQSLLGLLGIGMLFSIVTFLFRLCLAPGPGQKPGTFLTVMEFINLNYGMQLFHAKMEGEKLEVMLHVMLGMKHRRESIKYIANITIITLVQLYYWSISVLAVSFSSEVGRFLSRSPIILTLLQKHNKEKNVTVKSKDSIDDPTLRFTMINDGIPKDAEEDTRSLGFRIESLVSQRPSQQVLIQKIPQQSVEKEKSLAKMSSPGSPSFINIPEEFDHSERQRRQAILQIPCVVDLLPHIEIEMPVPQENQESGYKVADDNIADNDQTMSIQQWKLIDLPKIDPTPSIGVGSDQQSSKEQRPRKADFDNETAQIIAKKPLLKVRRYLRKNYKAAGLSIQKYASATIMIPPDFRPEAKEYMALDEHSLRQLNFFVADNTITKNSLYRFAPIVGFWRTCLLSIIVTKIVGDPVIQVSCGLSVEIMYLFYLIKSNYKSSLLEHWVEVVLQSLQALYLFLKILTILSILPDELKQDYLGLPMAISLGLIATINVLFVLYNMILIIWELIELIWRKCKTNDGDNGNHEHHR